MTVYRPMNVSELIEALQKLPEDVKDYPVALKGYDCYDCYDCYACSSCGDAGSVEIHGNKVCISRTLTIEDIAATRELEERARQARLEQKERERTYRERGLLPD